MRLGRETLVQIVLEPFRGKRKKTGRAGGFRIISAQKASRDEREIYYRAILP